MILYPRPAPLPRPGLLRPRGPGRPAFARGLALDKDFDENKHPRDDDGKFTKGASVAASLPIPAKHQGKGGKLIHSITHDGLSKGETPQQIADTIKAAVASYWHPNAAKYAKHALGHLEKEFGLAKGSLGKAVMVPGMAKAAPSIHPAKPADEDAQLDIEASEPGAEEEDLDNFVLSKEPPKPAPAAATPAMTSLKDILSQYDPHPDSIGQKQVYEIATSSDHLEEKITKIKNIAAAASPYTKDFANKWLHQLDPSGEVSAAKSQEGVITPPAHLKRYQRIKAIQSAAKDLPDATHEEATKIVPSLKQSWWKKADPEGRGAVVSYTGSSYSSINTALRKMGEGAAAHQIAQTQAIDDLFEEPGARLEQDVILRRGEGPLPDGVLDKYEAALKAGISVRMMKEGFISTSLSEDAAFGGKTKYEIVARKGTPALGVHAISGHKSENEVLLRHGQVFEVFEIKRGDYSTTIRMMTL